MSEAGVIKTTEGVVLAEGKATTTTFSLSSAFKGLASSLGITTTALGVMTGALAAVAIGAIAYKKWAEYQEDLRQSAVDASNALTEQSKSVDNYVERYQELQTALKNAKGDEQAVYSIKQDLLVLQNELNDAFGEEYGKLNLVTDAYKDQTEAIKQYNKELAQSYLNENESAISTAKSKMESDNHYNLTYTGEILNSDRGAILKEIAESYKDKGVSILDELGDGTYTQFSIHLNANAEDAQDVINDFMNDVREKAIELNDEDLFADVLEISSSSLNQSKNIIDEYGDIYKKALLSEIATNDGLSTGYNQITQAVESYNEAILKSEDPYNDDNVKNAWNNLQSIKQGIEENVDVWGKYESVTTEAFKQANDSAYSFYQTLQNDDNISKLTDDLKGLSNTDLQSMANDGAQDSFDKLCQSANDYGLEIQDVIDLLVKLGIIQGQIAGDFSTSNETRISSQSISQTIDQLNTQLKPAFDSLKDAYLDIFTLDDNGKEIFSLENVDLSMLDDIKSTIDELNENEELGINIDYSSFEDLSKTLMDSESTADEVRKSINLFATDIINALNPALNQTTGENYKFVQSLLESLNIINSEAVMISTLGYSYEEYILAKEECAEAGFDLANATQDEIDAFMYEEDGAIKCGEALALLELKKQLVNGTLLDTNSDIENVLTLAKAAGITIESLDKLAIAKSKFDEAIKTGDGRLIGSAAIELQHAKDEVENAILDFEPVNVDFAPKHTGKKSSSSDKDTSKEFDWIEPKLENIEKRMSQLRKVSDSVYSTFAEKNQALADQIHLVNEEIQLQQQAYEGYMAKANSIGLSDDYKKLVQEGAINIEKITDKELQEAISNYSEWYEKAKETQDKITDLHEQSKDLRVEAADNGANELKELLDHQAITEREYIDRMNDLWEFYYANQVELAEVAKDRKLELLEEEKDYLENVASAASSILDYEIDELEEQKENAIKPYQEQIEAIEDKKKSLEDYLDDLEDERKHEELILNLQKAQYELEKARNQRTKLVYKDGQMSYVTDDKAIKEKEQDVDDAKFELVKFNIEQQIEAYDEQIDKLNELIEQTEKYYDDQIEGLEKTKNEWEKMIELQERAMNITLFESMFGKGSVANLLAGDMSQIATWQQEFVDTLANIDLTANGQIGEFTKQYADLAGIDLSGLSEQTTTVASQFDALKESVNETASAIGGATGGANAQQGENGQGGANTGGGTNLVGAIGEVKTATDTALGSNGGEGKEGESAEGGGEGAIGKFSQLKTAVDAVTTAIGTGEEEEGSGEEGAINLIGALQTQYEIASEILPEEIAFFNELLASIMACVDGLNAMATSISSVSGVSVTPHAEGTVGKAFANGTGNYKGLAHAEKNALRSEYGQPELTVYPDGTTELTTEPTMSDLPKDTVIFNEEQTKRIMNNEGTVIGNAYADGNAVLQKASTPSYLRPIQEGDKGYELIKAARVYQDMLKTNIMLPVNSIDKNVEMMTRNISAVNTSNVNKPTVNVGGITVNCPNVNSKEIAMKVSTELEKAVFGMSNLAYQKANITR